MVGLDIVAPKKWVTGKYFYIHSLQVATKIIRSSHNMQEQQNSHSYITGTCCQIKKKLNIALEKEKENVASR